MKLNIRIILLLISNTFACIRNKKQEFAEDILMRYMSKILISSETC